MLALLRVLAVWLPSPASAEAGFVVPDNVAALVRCRPRQGSWPMSSLRSTFLFLRLACQRMGMRTVVGATATLEILESLLRSARWPPRTAQEPITA